MPHPISSYSLNSLLKGPFPAGVSIVVSQDVNDPEWDHFLLSSPLGQYQQSSLWAAAKSVEGWQVIRVVLSHANRILGGFQLLHRHTRLGRIGYISKGPVLEADCETNWDACLNIVCRFAAIQNFIGIVVQAPDLSKAAPEWFFQRRFMPDKTMGIIDATLWFELQKSPEGILAQMPGYNRTFIRQAIRRGVTIREGGEADLGAFFDLMLHTCRRQQESPNPANEIQLRQIWKALNSSYSKMRLAFAEHEGMQLAALTCIAFGERVTLWKKGWCTELGRLRPNHLLYYDFLCWASRCGYKICDFYSVQRETALAILRGETLSDEQAKSRDRYHLGFGAQPLLLPQAWIFIPGSFKRLSYKVATGEKIYGILRKCKLI